MPLCTLALQNHALAPLLHHGEHVGRAHQGLHDFLADLITEGATAGELRDDVPPGELAAFCLNALTGAGDLPDEAAVGRLVRVVLTALARPELPGEADSKS
jgi:hypothetical protein